MVIVIPPAFTSQVSMLSPNSGASTDRPPMNSTACDGVRWRGCTTANQRGSIPEAAMAYTRRLAPMRKAFQLVRMPAMPPSTSSVPNAGCPHSVAIASAAASCEPASSSSPSAAPVPRTMTT